MGTFAADVTKWVQKAHGNTDRVVRKVVLDLGMATIERTPVDSGRLVGNWQFAVDEIPNSSAVNTDNRSGAIGALQMATQGLQAGHIHYLVNNVIYAHVVEYGEFPDPAQYGSHKRGEPPGLHIHTEGGYSLQAPTGMVRVTVLEYQKFVADAVAQLP